MSDVRARRTGEQSPPLVKVMAETTEMRAQIDALEGRVLRLEAELATMRASLAKLTAPAPRPSKRPGAGVPPPLPPMTEILAGSVSTAPRKAGSRRSIVDISETAELIESIPPPPRAPRK
ncbi:hypothetical protein BH11MYX4_BH11MYX4_09340 [soil metagenome]